MHYEIVTAGVIVSLIFIELTGISPAGLIVPGYLALSLQTPGRIVYTLAVSLLAYDPGIIGVLIPGIAAQEMEKQGIVKSLAALAVVVGILALIMTGQGMQVFPI